jgi:hypothetical protein
MINTAYWNFQVMKDTFTIGDVAVYVPGVMDPPTSPMFSGIKIKKIKLKRNKY